MWFMRADRHRHTDTHRHAHTLIAIHLAPITRAEVKICHCNVIRNARELVCQHTAQHLSDVEIHINKFARIIPASH